jgi:hypothetical protein
MKRLPSSACTLNCPPVPGTRGFSGGSGIGSLQVPILPNYLKHPSNGASVLCLVQ